jgi:hypothetical protein
MSRNSGKNLQLGRRTRHSVLRALPTFPIRLDLLDKSESIPDSFLSASGRPLHNYASTSNVPWCPGTAAIDNYGPPCRAPAVPRPRDATLNRWPRVPHSQPATVYHLPRGFPPRPFGYSPSLEGPCAPRVCLIQKSRAKELEIPTAPSAECLRITREAICRHGELSTGHPFLSDFGFVVGDEGTADTVVQRTTSEHASSLAVPERYGFTRTLHSRALASVSVSCSCGTGQK